MSLISELLIAEAAGPVYDLANDTAPSREAENIGILTGLIRACEIFSMPVTARKIGLMMQDALEKQANLRSKK